MTPSPHDGLTVLLGPAALGLLTGPEQQTLDRHLQDCASCRAELTALRGVTTQLAVLDAHDALADQLVGGPVRTEAVMTAIARERAGERRRAQRWQTALATAASVAVLVAGLVSAGSLGDADGPVVPVESVAVTADDGVRATADLVAHTWGVEIKLVATGLDDGRPYTAQVTTGAGEVVGAGAFIGTGTRTLTCNLNTAVLRPDARSFVVLDSGGREVLRAAL